MVAECDWRAARGGRALAKIIGEHAMVALERDERNIAVQRQPLGVCPCLAFQDIAFGIGHTSDQGVLRRQAIGGEIDPDEAASVADRQEAAIVARPMMYVALTYDHRLVDGREAVTFLKRVKEYIEKPARLLLDL